MTLNKFYLLLLVLALAVLGSSIALNLVLFNRAKQYYVEMNQVRLDPWGLKAYPLEQKPRQHATTEPRVVFFGDSRAAGWTIPPMRGYEFINRGISSQTSVQVLNRFDAHVRPLQPDVVVVQVGINDLKTIPLFPARRKAIVADCEQNIRQIVEESRQLGAVVILSTIFPAGEIPLERQPFWSEEVEGAIVEVNRHIAMLAQERVLVLDAFSLLADQQGGLRREYTKNELHLNERGYERLNLALMSLLHDRIEGVLLQRSIGLK